jgi:hypothetical protein
MAVKKRRAGVEWVGGISSMPAFVTGEGEPYRPEMLIWMGAEGAILGSMAGRPGELLDLACESLQSTIDRPMFGGAHVPASVRVASPELASVLRSGHPAIDIVVAPTPEIDAILAMMREHLGEISENEQSYLSPGIGPEAVASFFRAAAGLFRARPWKVVPSDQSIFSITIGKLGLEDAAMSIIGQMGQSLGLILFSCIEDFEAYLDASRAMDHGDETALPPHFALNFERGAELGAAIRREVAEHRWEVAGTNAYPWLVAVDPDLVARPPTAREVAIAESIALALPEVLREKKALRAAWNGGEPVSRTLTVRTHAGSVEVTLRAPHGQAGVPRRPPAGLVGDLFDLARDGDEIDPDERGPLEDELVRRFAASPEARELSDVQSCRLVMDLAADYLGATIATLGPPELREIVFGIIPSHVGIDASEARSIIEENRAFYAFLKREFGLHQADACLRVLGASAVKRLESALSDTSNFGMAKSLFMAGREAGFDMDTEEGIGEWMRAMQSAPLPASIRLPSLDGPSSVDRSKARAKRKKRKATRKRSR